MDVIGVGSITVDDAISRFSSRGMTTWEVNYSVLFRFFSLERAKSISEGVAPFRWIKHRR
jgi:hypothetical protein